MNVTFLKRSFKFAIIILRVAQMLFKQQLLNHKFLLH